MVELTLSRRTLVRISMLLAVGSTVFGSAKGSFARTDVGLRIYQEKCASCHGAEGQGVTDLYEDPLHGDESVDALARLIERTMPEEDPDACVGDEAREVAEYVYHEFYSLEARQRKGLESRPRIELLHLTVSQHQNAIADLIGHFTPQPRASDRGRRDRAGRSRQPSSKVRTSSAPEPGLRAEYFQSKGMSKANELKQERIDRRVDFDYDEFSPVEGINADQFAVVWQGALKADDTGFYEFRVSTQNGARLYLNNDPAERRRRLRDDSAVAGQAALIDGWVSSGKMRQHQARVFLLGGRDYPIRLEFFKYLEKTASIRLEWKPPHGTWSVLDDRHLTTAIVPRCYVLETSFPADDRSYGFERGSSISREWLDATLNAAVSAANEVSARLPLLSGINDDTADRADRLREFVVEFATIAFRRPLTAKEDRLFREILFEEAPDPEAAVRRAVLLILKSPSFLYVDLTPAGQPPSQYAIASRLSFALWDSIPDKPLLEAASRGQLSMPDQMEAQARRMLGSPRARAKMRDFFHGWLELDERDMAKDKQKFPGFDEAVIADLRFSLEQFLEEVIWSETSDYRQLLLANHLVLNKRLRDLYLPDEANSPDSTTTDSDDSYDSEFQNVPFTSHERAGVLTHPYLLSAFAYHNSTSPIHRGVFLTRNIVGRALKPPPIAVAFKDDEFAPDLTMREKITQLTRDTACMSCHSVINPLGFALENFDAVGRWRTSDNNKPVDAKSEYTTADGKKIELTSARDVANFAVKHESAHEAFVTQVFQHLVKQSPIVYGPDTASQLRLQFADNNFNIQNLWVRVAAIVAAHNHTPPSHSQPQS